MWRSDAAARRGLAAAIVLVALGQAATGRASECLPPLFGDGSRLVSPAETRLLWLEPLLGQHEICRRHLPDERTAIAIGSSGIFGYPHAAPDTAVAMVNRAFDESRFGAHLFNLGMMWTYAPKDALILHETLDRHHADVIVYALTLDDFYHVAPAGFDAIDAFFLANSEAVDRAASAGIPGVGEAFELYRRVWSDDVAGEAAWRRFRELGRTARVAVRQVAVRARAALFPGMPAEDVPPAPPAEKYDCAKVHRFAGHWKNWKDWSLLPWLAGMRADGTRVLVVNWPVAEDAVGDCFNARYPRANFDEYNAWLASETAARGLDYLDLHDLLAPEQFLDSIHPDAEGQRLVALRLEAALREVFDAEARERARADGREAAAAPER